LKFLITLVFVFCINLQCQVIDKNLKKTVAFIFQEYPIGELSPLGTGFFVAIKRAVKNDTVFATAFITAKHVLKHKFGYYSKVFIRLNKKVGGSDTLRFDLFNPDGTKRILGNYERRIADIVPCFIFGFATRTAVSTLMKNLRAYNEERDIPPEEQIEGIFTLDDGYILNLREGDDRQQVKTPEGDSISGLVEFKTDHDILQFLRTILIHLPKHQWVSSVGVLLKYVTNPIVLSQTGLWQ